MGRIIATLSGGLASGYVAMMALAQYPRADVTLYFNDTLWEDGDLYRFLADLERVLQHPVTRDSDGRDVEELAYYHNALPNDRMPFCSRTLKADRLQRYMRDGDTLLFGIGIDERHRASRIATRYSGEAQRRGMRVDVRFPLIEQGVTRDHIAAWYASVGIAQPALYGLGFKHNNCGGGCVRQGRAAWAHLYHKRPEVYADRERLEREMSEHIGKPVSFNKRFSLTALRQQLEAQPGLTFDDHDDLSVPECFGVCATQQ